MSYSISITRLIRLVCLCGVLSACSHLPSNGTLKDITHIDFPPYKIVESSMAAGSHYNYFYTVRFKRIPEEDFYRRIDSLCKFGPIVYVPDTDMKKNPWEHKNDEYAFLLWFPSESIDDFYSTPYYGFELHHKQGSDLMYIQVSTWF